MPGEEWRSLFAEAARSLGLSPEPVIVARAAGGSPSRVPAGDAAIACIATALTAAAGLQRQRGGPRRPQVQVDAAHVVTAVLREAHVRVNGRGFGTGFAPPVTVLARGRWVGTTHGNYPRHSPTGSAFARTADAGSGYRPLTEKCW